MTLLAQEMPTTADHTSYLGQSVPVCWSLSLHVDPPAQSVSVLVLSVLIASRSLSLSRLFARSTISLCLLRLFCRSLHPLHNLSLCPIFRCLPLCGCVYVCVWGWGLSLIHI